MARKRITQIFPLLLPLRRWQRKKLFYCRMRLDRNRYAKAVSETSLPYTVFAASSLMINENSGFALEYQINKVHNLKLAAKTINKVVISPGETFSFWQLVRYADHHEKYKDGLTLVNGEIVGSYGGGLCQLSNMLFWMFLHTPMRIVERHGHAVQSFPSTASKLPEGADAAVSEGWSDLKVRNETDNTFQIEIRFDDMFMYGRILAREPVETAYQVFNSSVSYCREKGKVYQTAVVNRMETRRGSACEVRAGEEREAADERNMRVERELYRNRCEIAYELPDDIQIEIAE